MPSPKSKSGRRLLPPALLLDKCAVTVRLMVRQVCPEPLGFAWDEVRRRAHDVGHGAAMTGLSPASR